VVAGLVVWRPWTGGGSGSTFSFKDGRYVETSVPWHTTVSTGPGAPSEGCAVEVRRKTRSGPVIASPRHRSGQDNVILQVSKAGSFYLDYPHGCLVNAQVGGGDAQYPVRIPAGVGDSLAWNPRGPMDITAAQSSSFPCEVNMVDAETGGIELVTLEGAGDVQTYDPPATSSLYMRLSGTNCVVTARDAAPGS